MAISLDDIETLRVVVQSTLKELSGEEWTIEATHMKWDLHFTCQLEQNRAIQTEDLDLVKPLNVLTERAKELAKGVYHLYERRKARGIQ